MPLRRLSFLFIALGLSLAASRAALAEGRAFWLTRWNAGEPGRVLEALEGMAALGANTLFIQVLGDGMALHRSDFLPRSHIVAAGFDPLAYAIQEGHRRGIEVHAFINICNVWSGGLGVPASPSHVVRAHPEWSVVDVYGAADVELVGKPDTLIFFCPAWPGFRDHVTRAAVEIATRYDVDGIHLDYLRFPVGAPRCFCAEHRRSFEAEHGRPPTDGDPDFRERRFADITGLFGKIYDALGTLKPRLKVSAALVAPSGRYFQDARRILEAGKLDIACPMTYTADAGLFEERVRWFHEHSGGRLVFAGIQADAGAVGEETARARSVGVEGQILFSWNTLDAPGRAALAAAWSSPAAAPPLPWKDGSPDLAAPVISGVAVAGVLADEAAILWHSDEKTRPRVEYGLTSALGSAAEGQGFAFDHAVRLFGLRPSTTYHFRAVSTDPSGNAAASARSTFTTAATTPGEVVVDDGGDGFERSGSWSAGSSAGGWEGDYLFSSEQAQETAWTSWTPYLPRAGRWEVSVWYVAGANRVQDARYTIVHAEGSRAVVVDQRSGGGRWAPLGTFRFALGTAGSLRLGNQASGGDVVIADAARFRLVEADAVFVRGDAGGDGAVDISDGVGILLGLFLGQARAECADALDANDSGVLDLSDAVHVLGWLFRSGIAPPPPFPAAGVDPTPDGLPACR